jgi:hypothetical protein
LPSRSAFVFLDEPLVAGLVVGAALIVTGGILLASDAREPEHFKRIGLVYALVGDRASRRGTRSCAGSSTTRPTFRRARGARGDAHRSGRALRVRRS